MRADRLTTGKHKYEPSVTINDENHSEDACTYAKIRGIHSKYPSLNLKLGKLSSSEVRWITVT